MYQTKSVLTGSKDEEHRMKFQVTPIENVRCNDVTDVFYQFLEYWDKKRLKNYKEIKAIFFNDKKEAIAFCDISSQQKNLPISHQEMPKFNLDELVKKAQSKQAKTIVIAENFLSDDVGIDNSRIEFLENLKCIAEPHGIEVEDFISMNTTSYSSLKVHGLDLTY
ncbi:JAB domain-containing protein [Chryseolinea sp. H1M3-3]|uniref:JAB domain-containing protein n=1 Tax=Chryseolinea sp. H1M3-3 TaxID=3034144 RepID=UPI0023ED0015|nr:JAB domain-containing protein [Chryseolinea sp. H1M3-3]